jgi:copper chaperone
VWHIDSNHKDSEMMTFEVKDMTCGHCVSAITRAVNAVDQGAVVHVDLPTHRVQIEPRGSDAGQLRQAIQAAGYTAVPANGEAASPEKSVPRSGCCCR